MKPTLFSILGLTLFVSCHKDSDTEIGVIYKPDPPAAIIDTKLVTLTDTTSDYTTGVKQIFDGQTTSFDYLPFTYTKAVQIDRNYQVIQIVTPDNLEFSNVQTLVENDVNYVHLKFPLIEIFNGKTSITSEFLLSDQSKIMIPPHVLAFANENPFEGDYKIFVSVLDPSSAQSPAIPSFTGIDQHQETVSLLFKKCFFIEVSTVNGEKLIFKDGANIRTPLRSENSWLFDAAKGLWYVIDPNAGENIDLSTNGYYGLANKKPLIRVTGQMDLNGVLLFNQPLEFSYEGLQRTIYTTNTGKWSIQLPAATACTLKTELGCNQYFQKEFITTTSEGLELSMHIENSNFTQTLFKGTASDCEANALNDHIILLSGNQNKFRYNADPQILFPIAHCSAEPIGITGISPGDIQSGATIFWEPGDTIDMHSVISCDQAQHEYLKLNVAGDHKIYWDLDSRLNPQNRLIIENSSIEPSLQFQVAITGTSTGKFTDNMLNIIFEDIHLGSKGYALNCPTSSNCGFSEFTITHFPQQSGWIRGYFSGKFWIKTFNPLTAGYRNVEAEFQVNRDF